MTRPYEPWRPIVWLVEPVLIPGTKRRCFGYDPLNVPPWLQELLAAQTDTDKEGKDARFTDVGHIDRYGARVSAPLPARRNAPAVPGAPGRATAG